MAWYQSFVEVETAECKLANPIKSLARRILSVKTRNRDSIPRALPMTELYLHASGKGAFRLKTLLKDLNYCNGLETISTGTLVPMAERCTEEDRTSQGCMRIFA